MVVWLWLHLFNFVRNLTVLLVNKCFQHYLSIIVYYFKYESVLVIRGAIDL